MLQPLDITVFPSALDESLTNSIDLLQLQLEGIHLLLLELLWVEKVGEKRWLVSCELLFQLLSLSMDTTGFPL